MEDTVGTSFLFRPLPVFLASVCCIFLFVAVGFVSPTRKMKRFYKKLERIRKTPLAISS